MKRLIYLLTFLFALSTFGAKITDNTLKLGDGNSSNDKQIEMTDGIIQWDGAGGKLQFSNNAGGLYTDFGTVTVEDPAEFNNIDNAQAETNIAGWVLYQDAAGGSPVDGTGGSPNVAFSRITSGQLRKTGSFELSKDGSDRQGEGVSFDFTVEPADLNSKMSIILDYSNTANYADDDIEIFIYNIDDASLITSVNNEIKKDVNHIRVDFDTDAADDDYRLIFHIASASALTYDLILDNVKLIKARPNTITSVGAGQYKHFTAFVENTGTPAFVRNEGSVFTGLVDEATGDVSFTIDTGICSTIPDCNCTVQHTTDTAIFCTFNEAASTTTVRVLTIDHAGTAQNRGFNLSCKCQQ